MTPAELLRELALIAVVMVGWVALVLLMLERDRKRFERRGPHGMVNDSHQGAESSEARPSSSHPTKEPRATAAQEE